MKCTRGRESRSLICLQVVRPSGVISTVRRLSGSQTMIEPSFEMWPVLARWRQRSDDGAVIWHLAGVRADRGFWGYVHFRTQSRQENRNFSGTLDQETFDRFADLIQVFVQHAKIGTDTKPLDGLVGIGTRSSFRRIFGIRDGIAEPDDPAIIRAYDELLDLIQPSLAANIDQ